MEKEVIVIGGGIIGLCTAYYLQQDGHQVTVIDKGNMDRGASFVNAGYLTPSHIIPLAAPGMINKGLKWMFNSASPFYMQPRLDADFLKWAWHFKRSSTKQKVAKAIPVIKDINLLSKELYTELHEQGELGDFQFEKKGLLMLYKTAKAADSELEVAEIATREGLENKILDREALLALEPGIAPSVRGAVHYLCDAHTTPDEFMGKMIAYLENAGVRILKNTEIDRMTIAKGTVKSAHSGEMSFHADHFVVCSGAWSAKLARQAGTNLSLQAGKGYRINVSRELPISYPAVLCESKIAVTPMSGFTRLAGTMEFSGINHHIRTERVEAIAVQSASYYNGLHIEEVEKQDAQCGLRPVSPDGLPYIGALPGLKNAAIATGHAMMGWSLGPATGKLIAEIMGERPTSLDLTPFEPGRRF
ncbi:NAD(P)/FAD-dependent oxidoreductase [Robertkochia sediminum]|uniref:NAD(P)/FAD-dependent oxidoreductase n=1 Tax=Robertkochia sediminum TaxID=2785326 RepID=UPI001933A693|nr:FAD-dependent oxidoreductase [Robertkochia sediminum]MBL7473848.1 FAD-dependent oxidoreductase [Robertkochia sediminum]